ncbi:uncharacterized protein MELLADRAFT_87291 [Melampsora larici-populina 98AG31]|uniref:Metallothionein n=1 Tax=Melampsora larici-populina (strain 98AG31 / pathotype 3-4-7) TaxID=747676 RepID=F4RMQ1_MELLP|nr:uncharacterized protein MELLADRAFT_87291 [Melampsora larici-populina 98AG31]EGG06339.1 hypothetical protein MELLADRAFT_87291 [Melampsora larici-populina 98AG31]
MPACGCPDVKLENGSVRACACTPCGAGNLDGCSCNKETGCGCTSNAAAGCVCGGDTCSCSECPCKTASKGSCCA